MAQAPRSSSRPVRIRMNADYVYDSEAFSGLVRRRRSAVVFDQQQSQSAPADFSSVTAGNIDVPSHSWTGIDFVAQHINNDQINVCQYLNSDQFRDYQFSSGSIFEYQSRGTSPYPDFSKEL